MIKSLKLYAGVCLLIACALLFASHTHFRITLKDGTFDNFIQDQLPIRIDIQNAASVELNRVDIDDSGKLKMLFSGKIEDKRAQVPYTLDLSFRFNMDAKKIYLEPFMNDQKLNGVDFAVASEVVPKLFEVFKSEPLHIVKKKGLVWLSVSDAKFSNDDLKITISGFEIIELLLGICFFLVGTLVLIFEKRQLPY